MDGQDPDIGELVAAAAAGDQSAWDSLVDRYTPLIISVAGRYRLNTYDVADVSQTLWLRLVQHLKDLREPRALPGWIVTTTRNECLRVLRGHQRVQPFDPLVTLSGDGNGNGPPTYIDLDASLVQAERHEALLTAFAELSDTHRELLLVLLEDPPPTYADVSGRLGMPIGGIGPTRARALERLRRSPAIVALLVDEPDQASLQRTNR